MWLGRIASGDIVEALIRGRRVLGHVTEVNAGIVYFDPVCPGGGWRHAKARQIVAHWRKTRPRQGVADDESPR